MWKYSVPWAASSSRARAQAGLEEREVVGERVVVGERLQQPRAVAPAAEPDAIARRVGGHRERRARLCAPGVERRVDVDQVERAGGSRDRAGSVVTADHEVIGRA